MNQLRDDRLMDFDSGEQMPPPSMEPQSRNYLQAIWNRKWIVLACIAIGLCGAWIKYVFSTKYYSAAAQILVQQTGVQLNAQNTLGQSNNLYTQAELIKKPVVLVIARDMPGFMDMKTFAGKSKGEATQILADGLSTSVGKTDDLITVTFNCPCPKGDAATIKWVKSDAAAVVNDVVAAYKTFTTRQRQESVSQVMADSAPSRQKLDDEIKKQEDALANFRKTKGVNWGADQGSALMARLEALDEAQRQAQDDTATAKQNFDAAVAAFVPDPEQRKELSETGHLNGVVSTFGVDEVQLQMDLRDAQEKLAELRLRYLENHPAVQTAQAKLNELSGMYVMLLRQKWVMAQTRENQAIAEYNNEKKLVDEMNENRAEYTRKTDDLDRNRKLLDTIDTQLKQFNMASETAPISVQVYQEATVSDTPTIPNRPMLLFEGVMLGLIVGLGLSLVDQRLRSVDEISATLGLPVLGSIPSMSRRQTLMSRGRKVHLDPMSDVSEAYRNIRTAVFFGAPEEKAKTILVTSATRGNGKSTLASNLAIAIAEAGHHVLLIDADLREPTQHRIFGASADRGVSSVVAGRTTLDRATQATAIKNLDILPCGPIPLNPAEIINNQAFADMLDILAQRYDRIILDSPPVMPVTDARILGATCDLTLLVLRAEHTTRRAASDARDGLLGFGARILGVVVNGGRRRQAQYSYYGHYGQRRTRGSLPHHSAANGDKTGASTDLMVLSKGR